MSKKKIDQEVALEELRTFLSKYIRRFSATDAKLKDEYPDVLEAIELGLLTFPDNKPVYQLETPVKNEEGEVSFSKVEFKTRIKPSTKANLAEGLDLKKSAVQYGLNVTSYASGIPKPVLDRLDKFDFDVVQQVVAVFS